MTSQQAALQVTKHLCGILKTLIVYFGLYEDFKDEFKFDNPPTLKPRAAENPRRIGGSSRQRSRD